VLYQRKVGDYFFPELLVFQLTFLAYFPYSEEKQTKQKEAYVITLDACLCLSICLFIPPNILGL
jgi:hypothetical protein